MMILGRAGRGRPVGGWSDGPMNERADHLAVTAYQKKGLLIDDGYEATLRLRNDKVLKHNAAIPVVALTAHATEEHKMRSFDSGLSDFLTKPLRLGDLRRVLRKWLPKAVRLEGVE